MIETRTASVQQWDEWRQEMRGLYTPKHTMNRVGRAIKEVAGFIGVFFRTIPVMPNVDFNFEDIPSQAELEKYLYDISAIREVVAEFTSLPSTPTSMINLTLEQANDIERILALAMAWAESAYAASKLSSVRSGSVMTYSGSAIYIREAD